MRYFKSYMVGLLGLTLFVILSLLTYNLPPSLAQTWCAFGHIPIGLCTLITVTLLVVEERETA